MAIILSGCMKEIEKDKKQIFYDPFNNRQNYLKWCFFGVAIFALVVFISAILSVLFHPVLGDSAPPATGGGTIVSASGEDKVGGIGVAEEEQKNFKTKMIAFYVSWDRSSFASLQKNIEKIDQIVPEWYHLQDSAGTISVGDLEGMKEVFELMKEEKPSLRVTPLINNFNPQTDSWESGFLDGMLNDPSARIVTVNNLFDLVRENKFDGVHIDFENIPDSSLDEFSLFIKELYEKFHPNGYEVSLSVPLANMSYDVSTLSKYSDFIALMAYDQNTVAVKPPDNFSFDWNNFFMTPTGSIASQAWFEEQFKIRAGQMPPEKIVLSLGNFGYDWAEGEPQGKALTFQEAMSMARKFDIEVVFDKEKLNPNYSYKIDGVRHQVWFLDAVTSFNQVSFADGFNLYGYALWRLGSEDPSVWKVLNDRENLGRPTLEKMEKIGYGYDFEYEGVYGEVMKIASLPENGLRKMVFNQSSGLIIEEKIKKYPLPYVVSGWGGGLEKNKIAITFDDGPDPEYTNALLDILKKNNVKATFFIVGGSALKYPEIVKRIAEEGHELGNHTFSHSGINEISEQQFDLELSATQRVLGGLTGRHTVFFRAPYGEDEFTENTKHVKPLISLSDMGYYSVSSFVDPKDWKSNITSEEITERVIKEVESRKGNILLLHDGGGDRSKTVEALAEIIAELKYKGFEFATVSELMKLPAEEAMPTLSFTEKKMAFVNKIAIMTTGYSNKILSFFFSAGIIIGLLRSVFVGVMALIRTKKIKEKNGVNFDYRLKASVIIPAYNEEKVIHQTVKSILGNDYENLEIIIVDDGSTDDTVRLLKENFSGHLKVDIFSIQNGGKANALNFGIKNSSGDVLITLDADTVFEKDTISKLVRHFKDENVGAVAGNAKVGNRIGALTKCQALEYITSQNLDKKAFDYLNCIPVVPGAVGAWRREAILKAGGFSTQTLAEDTDLTFAVIRNGYRVIYEEEAVAFTEAPDTINGFLKQRFRWMFGTLQTIWKHRDISFRPKYKALGFLSVPNAVVFQIIFPLISPIMDFMVLFSVFAALWRHLFYPQQYSSTQGLLQILLFYLLFLLVDFFVAALAFALEPKEDKKLLVWIVAQRFFYRQLLYFVAIKTTYAALAGTFVGWNKLERKATVSLNKEIDSTV